MTGGAGIDAVSSAQSKQVGMGVQHSGMGLNGGSSKGGGLYTPPPFPLDSTWSPMDYSDSTWTPLGLVHQPTAAKLLVPVPVQSKWSPSGIPVLLGIPRTGQVEFTRTDGTRSPLGQLISPSLGLDSLSCLLKHRKV